MREEEKKLITILVVDDNPLELKLRAKILKKYYNVITATDGEKALDVLLSSAAKISIVVTDHEMPNMTGAELINLNSRLNGHCTV